MTLLDPTSAAPPTGLAAVLGQGGVRSVYQSIIDLASGDVVGFEALARGPRGPWERPDTLFAAARAEGLLPELDHACRAAAFAGAVEHGLLAPLTLFVNVEPEVIDSAPLYDLMALTDHAPGELRVVLEITERALAARPAGLLRTVERVRDLGWGVALDDVGADSMSLAFMALLRPDVVKLDLRLVQDRPGPAVAEIMNAVNAYAERSGALVLAEGIETPEHLLTAQALGATLGQGWLFGRPEDRPRPRPAITALQLPPPPDGSPRDSSPFSCLPAGAALRTSRKTLLIELSKQLEREALRLGETCVVAATFQQARHFTPSTAQRYSELARRTGFVCALGEGLLREPAPGVRGAELAPTDPMRGEWDVVVLGPHFAAALLARDLGDGGPDAERRFEYALTYDRDAVVRATYALLSRVAPRPDPVEPLDATVVRVGGASDAPAARVGDLADEGLLRRALGFTTSGVSIADVRDPGQPLIYVNAGFETLTGLTAGEVLGRNCRFLQSPDTDPVVIERMREALAAGREVRETILNVRGPQQQPWWNEVWLAPVHDDEGRLVQYIGVQNDVTARVEGERALRREQEQHRAYTRAVEQLALSDALTGLPNRRGAEQALERSLEQGDALAVLFLDLDGFKAVNDARGHVLGDRLLVQVAGRLRDALRGGDLVARLGGDEFLVVLPGLDQEQARAHADAVGRDLVAVVGQPFALGGEPLHVTVSAGVAVSPTDGTTFRDLVHAADVRMYARKRPVGAA